MSIAITAARNSSGELRHNSATTSLDDNKQEREVCERTNSEAKGLHATTHPLVTDTCAALAAPSNGYLSIKTYENPAYHSRALSLSLSFCAYRTRIVLVAFCHGTPPTINLVLKNELQRRRYAPGSRDRIPLQYSASISKATSVEKEHALIVEVST
jgi:hypothetical protein